MNRAMFEAASGMAAEETRLDAISENLANADTPGFKQSDVEFADALQARDGGEKSVVFKRGRFVASQGPFDVAIDGNGFFPVRREDGVTLYTRDGSFARAADGSLRTKDGAVLEGIKVPNNALDARVNPDGSVFVDTATAKNVRVGQIRVALFPTPEHLRTTDGVTFEATPAAGHVHLATPGTGSAGRLAFHELEKSNVSIMESMMEILAAQRAFEANAKGVQAADDMLRIANNIERDS